MAVKEIIYPDANSGLNANPVQVEAGSPDATKKKHINDAARLQEYKSAGYTLRDGDDFLYSPSGERSNVRFDGSLENDGVPTIIGPREEEVGGVKTEPSAEGNPISQPTSTPNGGTPKNAPVNQGLKNADLNFNQYGDDSSAKNQGQAGGMNEKYTGEGVKNSNVNYDPNARFNNLDPNYQFGMAGQYANSDSAGYLARRNDQIASALYNEYKGNVSKENVISYLASQNGWNNSSEEDRVNTVESIWKRIGEYSAQNQDQGGSQVDNSGVEKLKDDLANNGGTITGKDTPDKKTTINTNTDVMSVEDDIARSRANKLSFLASMDSASIAASIVAGTSPYGDQAWRDLETYYPEKAAEVKAIEKQIRGQNTVNSISQGGVDYDTGVDTSTLDTSLTSFAVGASNNTVTATELLKSIDSILGSNEAAGSAKDVMTSIEEGMAKLKNRLKNLKSEANQIFKGDTPDYLVKAYIANRTAEIQDNMQILEDRYNAAYSRYKMEVEQAQWQAEYDLKKENLELEWYKAKQAAKSKDKSSNSNYTRTERNNNPTAMTSAYVKDYLGGELGVDYEIGDEFVGEDGRTYYTAKLIGDPIETTIRLFDRGAEMNSLANDGGVLGHWHLGISNKQWLEMSDEEKRDVIVNKILKQEGGSIDNMAYYLGGGTDYDQAYEDIYTKYLSGNYSKTWMETTLNSMGLGSENELDAQARAWKADKDAGKFVKETSWTDRFGETYDFSSYEGWKNMTDEERELTKGVLDYREDPFKITGTGVNGESQRKIRAAALALGGEDYNAANFERNYNLVKKFDNATQSGGELSRNATAAEALKDLYEIYHNTALESNGRSKVVNRAVNGAIEVLWGPAAIAEFDATRNVAASELAGALKGNASPTDPEIQEYKNALSHNLNKEQFDATIKKYSKQLFDKLASEVSYYTELTGEKPYNIYNKYAGLSDWFGNEVGVDLNKYFSGAETYEEWAEDVKGEPTYSETKKPTNNFNFSESQGTGADTSYLDF